MGKAVQQWKANLLVFLRSLPVVPRRGPKNGPGILAIVRQGSDRLLLQTISQQSGWMLTLSGKPGDATLSGTTATPPIVIYDRGIAPLDWHQAVGDWARKSPRPYVILLSPNTDSNLWDELQRVGGSDILRSPLDREQVIWAVKRAWVFWQSEQKVRSLLQHPATH